MSTDYMAVCVTCKCVMRQCVACGSGFYGFKVWDNRDLANWMGHGMPVGTHEGHDVRIMSEHKFSDMQGDDDWPET